MYQVVEPSVLLCLDCYFKYNQIQQQQSEDNERMMNYLSDQIASTVGMPSFGPRFPERPRPVIVAGTKLNNISVNNSVIGTINTGSIGTVDQSIAVLAQAGEHELAKAIKALSEAILQSNDLTGNQKNDLVDSLSVITKEAATPKADRKNSVALALLEHASKVTSMANDITDICQKWWPVLVVAFSVAT
ncbi:MAG: hypothetical protein ABL923_05200 [Burkholderiaceae bacterium]